MATRKNFTPGETVIVKYRGLKCEATYKQVQRKSSEKFHLVYIPRLNKEELVDDVNILKMRNHPPTSE